MTDAINDNGRQREPRDPGDPPEFVRTAPSPVTLRRRTGDRGQGTGGAEGADESTPRAGGARAPARDRIVAHLTAMTQSIRDIVGKQGRTQLWEHGAPGPVEVWRYTRGEAWMRGSTHRGRRWAGYFWAVVFTMPMSIVNAVWGALMSRVTTQIATFAVLAALWGTWPADTPHTPPPASPVAVQHGGTR